MTPKLCWKLLSTMEQGVFIWPSANRLKQCNQKLPMSHLQYSSLRAKSPGQKYCIRFTWSGYMPSVCSVLHSLERGTLRYLAVLLVLARELRYTVWTTFFIQCRFVKLTLDCNSNAGECTGISRCLVKSSKHSSCRYPAIRKTSLVFRCSMTCIDVTQPYA